MIEDTHNDLSGRRAAQNFPVFHSRHDHQYDLGQSVDHVWPKGPESGDRDGLYHGTHCIGDSARMIEYGDADMMVAGGAESTVSPLAIGGFASARALSTRNDDPETASRPWDNGRDGFVLGEGAGVLVLEEYEHAKARGARIYAELAGFGMSADAYHMTAPDTNGPCRSMVSALKNAGVQSRSGSLLERAWNLDTFG